MKRLDLSGKVFGKLKVLGFAGIRSGRTLWNCACDCGKTTTVYGSSLYKGITESCGCLRRESVIKHGHTADGHPSTTYMCWHDMKVRCRKDSRYVKRGTKVCDRWQDFKNFLEDMGEQPSGMTLERKNNAGNYEPGNCVWSTRKAQANNRSSNRLLTFRGETKTLAEWATVYGLKPITIHMRLKKSWSVEKALETSVTNDGRFTKGHKKGLH